MASRRLTDDAVSPMTLRGAQVVRIVGTATLLASCAPRPAPPLPSPAAAYDGLYTGTANGSCGTGEAASLNVRNHRFTLSVESGLRLEGAVTEGGEIAATEPAEDGREVNFNGQIEGGFVRGGSYNGRCGYAYEMQRRIS